MAVEIIAEIGVNHNGSVETAKELIDAIALSGANTVKTQYYITENLCEPNHPQFNMLKSLELSFDQIKEIRQYTLDSGLKFLVSVFCLTTLNHMEYLGQDRYKIASGEIGHEPLIEAISKTKKTVIASFGMTKEGESEKLLSMMPGYYEGMPIFSKDGYLIRLYCVSAYPAPYEQIDLHEMNPNYYTTNYEGFSDHTIGPECAIAAVALGAEIIEKHITLDRTQEGPDHHMSMQPLEFKEMVSMIRNVEKALQPAPVNTALKPYVTRKYSEKDGKWLRRVPK